MQSRCNTCLQEFKDNDIVCGYEHYDVDDTYRPDGLQKPESFHLIHENCLGRHDPKTQPCPSCNKTYDFYCGSNKYSAVNSGLRETFPELFDDVELVKKQSPKKTVFMIDSDSDSDTDGKAKGRSFKRSKSIGFSFKKRNSKGTKRSKKSKKSKKNKSISKKRSKYTKINKKKLIMNTNKCTRFMLIILTFICLVLDVFNIIGIQSLIQFNYVLNCIKILTNTGQIYLVDGFLDFVLTHLPVFGLISFPSGHVFVFSFFAF